jgi:hypothetical protein
VNVVIKALQDKGVIPAAWGFFKANLNAADA